MLHLIWKAGFMAVCQSVSLEGYLVGWLVGRLTAWLVVLVDVVLSVFVKFFVIYRRLNSIDAFC